MLNLLGGLFKFLWGTIKLIGTTLYKIAVLYFDLCESTILFLGLSTMANEVLATIIAIFVYVFYYALFAIIPELIVYNTGKLTKKYKNLKSEEEKKEYLSERSLLFTRIGLMLINRFSRKKAKVISKVPESLNCILSDKIIDELEQENIEENKEENNNIENNIINNIENESKEIDSEELEQDNIKENKEKNNNIENNIINNIENESKEIDSEELKQENNFENEEDNKNQEQIIDEKTEPNVKLMYTSNIIGNVLRKGVVLKRKLLNDEKPFLVDFSSMPPKEVFTGEECNNITLSKAVGGKKVELDLSNPDLLKNPKLYEELSIQELEELKQLLLKDLNYQFALRNFFAMNKKALVNKKN